MAYIRWSQSIWPLFLLIARLHLLNPLTYGPPPMYWLGTSRWCLALSVCSTPSKFCFFLAFTPFLLPLCLFNSIVRIGWCLSFVAWKMCGLLGSYSLPFTPSWTRHCLGKSLHLPTKPMFSSSISVGLLVIDPAISLHVPAIALFFL